MKEIADILTAWRTCRAAGRDAALATVVRVDGSAYRRPGARMLILDDGQTVGSVSGGCIERDVLLRAGAIRAGAPPVVARYESISEEEAGPAASLGCGGTVDVLIEPLRASDENNPLHPLNWLWSRRKRGIIATTISGPTLGWQTALDIEGQTISANSQSSVLSPQSLIAALVARCSQHERTNTAEVFLEYVEPSQELIIFGAGADAVPMAALAHSLGWRVTVIDLRSGPVVVERKFEADSVLRRRHDDLGDLTFSFDAAVVVMTHNWSHDLAVLGHLAGMPLRYLGILGPRKRTERMLARLDRPNAEFLRYPVGLDIGARNPEEIALAIIAEITSVRRDASGGPLHNRPGPIHARPDSPEPDYSENSSCSRAAL